MSIYPKAFGKFFPNLFFTLAIPAFFLVSVLLYEPKALCKLMMSGENLFQAGNIYSFNIVICFVIILGTMMLTRLFFWLMRKHLPMTLWRYTFWCLGEIMLCCAFTALYLVLVARGDDSWFSYFGRCVNSIGSVLIYPYLIISLFYCYSEARNSDPAGNDTRLKFYDNRHQLKFITEAQSVLYIESNVNNIILHYLENGIEKRFQIRNSMKNIEPLCEQAGFARTHRCFIVNPLHIKTIRKEPGGFNFADLGCDRSEGIPISKKYYENITSLL
ncbi:MAG: LytTR family transcriptional regulator [Bacteroidales bacterium]|nr:LytTR family transcriptional regulator [Bacteroidales bacterium]